MNPQCTYIYIRHSSISTDDVLTSVIIKPILNFITLLFTLSTLVLWIICLFFPLLPLTLLRIPSFFTSVPLQSYLCLLTLLFSAAYFYVSRASFSVAGQLLQNIPLCLISPLSLTFTIILVTLCYVSCLGPFTPLLLCLLRTSKGSLLGPELKNRTVIVFKSTHGS